MKKSRYEILRQKFALPICDLAMTYESSALTIENKLVNKKVVKCFEELKKALTEQLETLK